jgi:2-phosphoglycerate kinase
MNRNTRLILIGGTSHSGKSTVAKVMGERLGWRVISTDTMGRHPGRPWRKSPEAVPGHVAWHYLSMPVEELVEDVLRHYRVNVWPRVEELVRDHAARDEGLVMEGSALWPELVAGLKVDGVAGVWLTGSREMFERRIFAESGHAGKAGREREMIEKFLARTVGYDALMMEAVERLGLAGVRVDEGESVECVAERCLEAGSAR